jgi:hypothetical protein
MLVFYLFVTYEGLLPYKPANLGNWHISANLDIGWHFLPLCPKYAKSYDGKIFGCAILGGIP